LAQIDEGRFARQKNYEEFLRRSCNPSGGNIAIEIKKQQTDDNSKKEYCEDELDKAFDKKKGLAQAALHRLTQISRQPSMMIHRQGW
jgi:hypothetical protein